MKRVMFALIFVWLVFPVFSQDASAQRFQSLSDAMGSTLSSSNSKLQSFDDQINDTGNTKTYGSYREKYEDLTKALQESEARLNRLIQSNDRNANIKAERDNYESLIKKLDTVKSDYDNWLKSVQ